MIPERDGSGQMTVEGNVEQTKAMITLEGLPVRQKSSENRP